MRTYAFHDNKNSVKFVYRWNKSGELNGEQFSYDSNGNKSVDSVYDNGHLLYGQRLNIEPIW